ncbi:Hypothetical protein A7982_00102 [Minicystis rosea]|nr:Hypothetical protein A7982_00102 [Minicystis rosea]
MARDRSRDVIALAALFAAALVLRIAFRIDYDEDIDALRFRLGVERFSVIELRPHPPFYPVYVAAAKLVMGLGASGRGALAITGAIWGAALVVITALLAREMLGRRAALVAGALALASPFLWLTSEKLLSDTMGALTFTAALWLCARARRVPENAATLRTAALVLLGVGLGVRLSYFPIALACLAVIARDEGGGRAWMARTRDLLCGVVPWLVPLVVIGGTHALVRTMLIQGAGHFTKWGGSAITVSSPATRLYGVVWGLWANVLAGPWIDAASVRWIAAPAIVVLLVLASARIRAAAMRQPEIAVAAAAYFVWAVLGQNTAYKPRHFLPLAPLVIVTLAAGACVLAQWSPRITIAAVALIGVPWMIDGAALARAHREHSPAAAIVEHLRDANEGMPVITAELGRMISEGAPGRTVIQALDPASLADAASRVGPHGALITTEALSAEAVRALTERGLTTRVIFARPRSRYVDSLWVGIGLAAIEARP